jgi:hypothetical protein
MQQLPNDFKEFLHLLTFHKVEYQKKENAPKWERFYFTL